MASHDLSSLPHLSSFQLCMESCVPLFSTWVFTHFYVREMSVRDLTRWEKKMPSLHVQFYFLQGLLPARTASKGLKLSFVETPLVSALTLAKAAWVLSHVWLLATPCTIAHQDPLLMQFSRQEYWSGLPFPPPGDLHNPGTELASPALAGRFFTHWATWEATKWYRLHQNVPQSEYPGWGVRCLFSGRYFLHSN